MVKIRIKKDNQKFNPNGRKDTVLVLMNSRVLVNDTDWTEIDDTEFELSCINPNFFEIEGGKQKPVSAVVKPEPKDGKVIKKK